MKSKQLWLNNLKMQANLALWNKCDPCTHHLPNAKVKPQCKVIPPPWWIYKFWKKCRRYVLINLIKEQVNWANQIYVDIEEQEIADCFKTYLSLLILQCFYKFNQAIVLQIVTQNLLLEFVNWKLLTEIHVCEINIYFTNFINAQHIM